MKTIPILFLSCFCAFGQSPLTTGSGIDWTRASAPSFDPTTIAGLFIYLATDKATSMTNAADATTVKGWTNIVSLYTLGQDVFKSSGASMNYVLPGPSAGIGAVDFLTGTATAGSSASHKYLLNAGNNYGTNQPITWYFVTWVPSIWCTNLANGNTFQVLKDDLNFGEMRTDIDPIVKYVNGFAGSFLSTGNGSMTTISNWFCLTYVANGGSSAIYTNGVLMLSGASGANTTGEPMLGSDKSFTTQYMGKLACVLAYGGAHSSGTITTVSTGLKSRFGY